VHQSYADYYTEYADFLLTTAHCMQTAVIQFRLANYLQSIITGRMPRSAKMPVLNLTTRQKFSIFAMQGRLVAPIHVKFGTTKGIVGPLDHTKFHANSSRGWERGPKISKIYTFW